MALAVIVLREYLPAKPSTLEIAPEYKSCRSWVSLQEPVTLNKVAAVISYFEFALRALVMNEVIESAFVDASSEPQR